MLAKRILIIHTWGIGDWLMFTPNLRDMAQAWPGVHIEVMYGNAQVKPLLGLYSEISQIAPLTWHNILRSVWRALADPYDLIIFTCGISLRKSELVGAMIRAKMKLALDRTGRDSKFLTTLPYEEEAHLLKNNRKLISPLNIPHGEDKVYLKVAPTNNVAPGSVLMHPGSDAASKYKRWPAEKFAGLAEKLLSEGRKVTVLLGPSEMELSPVFSKINHDNFSLVAGISFREAVELVAGHEFFLNSDSGMGHIAAALNKKVFTIFGPADPAVYKPFGEHVNIITSSKKLDCMPCVRPGGLYGCCEQKCLEDVTAECVFELLQRQ